MDPSKYAELFLTESRDHLTNINQQLLAWEKDPGASEPVDGVFRSMHTIKGMAASVGFANVATLAHQAENVLGILRERGGSVDAEVLELLFQTADALERAVEWSAEGRGDELDLTDVITELDNLAVGLGGGSKRKKRKRSRPSRPVVVPAAPESGRLVQVTIRPEASLKGARALIVLRRAETLGVVSGLHPPAVVLESEAFDGRFQFRLESGVTDAALQEAIRAAGEIEEIEISTGPVARPEPSQSGEARHIRVDLRRINALMNLIGELVNARGRLAELSAERADPDLDDVAITVSRLTSELQAEIIQARMTPVWRVFDRFPRLVRDLARQLGKQVDFRMEGKEIELDRAILDEIGDPLVHLLRNALDHGIEPAEERERAGKARAGRLVLSAVRERSTVAIRVADDGRGIDRDKILALAKARGVLPDDVDTLGDDKLLSVLAHPGFTTAGEVSDVSGRGVGIDVTVNSLRRLGGSAELKTELGRGSSFTLRLPPTLAIIPAMIARVGEERYALPLTHVEETVELDPAAVTDLDEAKAIVLRDRVIPLVFLRELVRLEGATDEGRAPVIILQVGDRRSGLVVDRMAGQQEIVVKTFDAPQGTLPIFSGATILSDGQPVLILDAGGLV